MIPNALSIARRWNFNNQCVYVKAVSPVYDNVQNVFLIFPSTFYMFALLNCFVFRSRLIAYNTDVVALAPDKYMRTPILHSVLRMWGMCPMSELFDLLKQGRNVAFSPGGFVEATENVINRHKGMIELHLDQLSTKYEAVFNQDRRIYTVLCPSETREFIFWRGFQTILPRILIDAFPSLRLPAVIPITRKPPAIFAIVNEVSHKNADAKIGAVQRSLNDSANTYSVTLAYPMTIIE
jgi:hypothetical protein